MDIGGRTGKVGPSAKVGPHCHSIVVCNAVKATVLVFTPPGDIIQRRICFFGANAKR